MTESKPFPPNEYRKLRAEYEACKVMLTPLIYIAIEKDEAKKKQLLDKNHALYGQMEELILRMMELNRKGESE